MFYLPVCLLINVFHNNTVADLRLLPGCLSVFIEHSFDETMSCLNFISVPTEVD